MLEEVILYINIFYLDFIQDTWKDYITECGQDKYTNDPKHTEVICNDKYKYADVKWTGYVIRVDYNENFFARYRISLLIKMEAQNQSEDPDLYLKFTDYQYELNKHHIFNITRGDYVSFNATFVNMGDGGHNVPFLEAFGFDKQSGHIYIQPHIHHSGRYSVPHETVIHKDNVVYSELPDLVSDDDIKLDQRETYH